MPRAVAWDEVTSDLRFQEASEPERQIFAKRWFDTYVKADPRWDAASPEQRIDFTRRAIEHVQPSFTTAPAFSFSPEEESIKPSPRMVTQELPPEPTEGTVYLGAAVDPLKDIKLGYQASAQAFYHSLGNISGVLDKAAEKISQVTGLERGGAFQVAERYLRHLSEIAGPRAEEVSDRQGFVNLLYQSVGSAPLAIAEYGTAGQMLGPIAGMAVVDAIREADKGAVSAAIGAAKGATFGSALHTISPLAIAPRAAVSGGVFAAAQPGGVKERAVAGITGAGLAGLGSREGISLREAIRRPSPVLPVAIPAEARPPGIELKPITPAEEARLIEEARQRGEIPPQAPVEAPPALPEVPQAPPEAPVVPPKALVAPPEARLAPEPTVPTPPVEIVAPGEAVAPKVEERPIPISAELTEVIKTKSKKILREVVSLLPEEIVAAREARARVEFGEAGLRMPVGEGIKREFIGIPSSFPEYFKNKGYKKKETLLIIDKGLEGKPLTAKQESILRDLAEGQLEEWRMEGARDADIQYLAKEEVKQQGRRAGLSDDEIQRRIAETGDRFRKAEEERIESEYPGEIFKPEVISPAPVVERPAVPEKAPAVVPEVPEEVPPREVPVVSEAVTPPIVPTGVPKLPPTPVSKARPEVVVAPKPSPAVEARPAEAPPIAVPQPTEVLEAKTIAIPPKYSISEEDYSSIIGQQGAGKAPSPSKIIPPKTSTGEEIIFPQEGGRHIEAIYEREIGPVLQLSTRMKKWLGVYYGEKGKGSGLVRVKTLENLQTLAHETGHFLDDVLGEEKVFPLKPKGVEREELIAVTKIVRPFEEKYVPILSEEGEPLLTKKGKERMKPTSYTAYRRSRTELFADYVAMYVADPAKAKSLAPEFTKQVEAEIAKNKEFAYTIEKMREYNEAFKPLIDYVQSLRKIPEINVHIKTWELQGNFIQNLWREKIGDKLWNMISRGVDRFGRTTFVGRNITEKRGLDDDVFEILRQRKKLIDGQALKVEEEIISPLSKLSKESQEYVSSSLERFEVLAPVDEKSILTESARKELAVFGNEARKLGLLNDFSFWNQVGQYRPYFYTEKEFAANKAKYGTTFLSKTLRANLSSYKHRLTDEEMGQKALESKYGTWPSSQAKIAEYTRQQKIEIGKAVREEMGLIKTAAYPLKVRMGRLIQSIYTVKALNEISKLPGLVGGPNTPGYVKLPGGKGLGALSEQWVPENIAREINRFNETTSEIMKVIDTANSVYKTFKVPFSLAAVSRNAITNVFSMWLAGMPIYNPKFIVNGVRSFINRDEIYKSLRDRGLYKHTYSTEELKSLAFQIEANPETGFETIIKWAGETYQAPGRFYGAVEDASKTVMAKYALDQGASVEQAIKFSDTWLFDYSSVSSFTAGARRTGWPFATWSSKIFPRLVETAVRRPEKYIFFYSIVAAVNAMSRMSLGISKKDEEESKPEYFQGVRHATILMPSRDENKELNWVNLDYFLPWGGWINTVRRSPIGMPQPVQAGNPFISLYNAWVQNYDPYKGVIAKDYMTESRKIKEALIYTYQAMAPDIFGRAGANLIRSIDKDPNYAGRTPSLGKEILKDTLGISVIAGGESTTKIVNEIEERKKEQFRKYVDIREAVEEGVSLQDILKGIESIEDKKAAVRIYQETKQAERDPIAKTLIRATTNEQKIEILDTEQIHERFKTVDEFGKYVVSLIRSKIISSEVAVIALKRYMLKKSEKPIEELEPAGVE